MTIKAVTDLKKHLFLQKNIDNVLTLYSLYEICHPPKIDTYDVLALVFFRYSIDHLIF